jgi:hypothetical protein
MFLAVGPDHRKPFKDATLTRAAAPTPAFDDPLVVLLANHLATISAGFGMESITDIAHTNQDVGAVPAVR